MRERTDAKLMKVVLITMVLIWDFPNVIDILILIQHIIPSTNLSILILKSIITTQLTTHMSVLYAWQHMVNTCRLSITFQTSHQLSHSLMHEHAFYWHLPCSLVVFLSFFMICIISFISVLYCTFYSEHVYRKVWNI